MNLDKHLKKLCKEARVPVSISIAETIRREIKHEAVDRKAAFGDIVEALWAEYKESQLPTAETSMTANEKPKKGKKVKE